MSNKPVEVELRAEIKIVDVDNFKTKLNKIGKMASCTDRLSVMYFGEVNGQKVDARVRTTNGECEVVVKFGPFGAHDRIELCQKIGQDQFLGMARIFSQFKFAAKVGKRKTVNYELPDGITASLVLAGDIAYIELEKMSSESDVSDNKIKLQSLADNLGLQVLDEDKFDILCQKLNESDDWAFHGSDEDYLRLKDVLGALYSLK